MMAAGALGDRGLDGGGVEAEVVGLDVGEHRRRAGERDRVGRRREGERRHDDLVARADAGGEQAEVQARGAGVDGDAGAPLHEHVGELLLERRDLGTLRDHAGAQHAVDRLALVVADDRLRGAG